MKTFNKILLALLILLGGYTVVSASKAGYCKQAVKSAFPDFSGMGTFWKSCPSKSSYIPSVPGWHQLGTPPATRDANSAWSGLL